MSWIILIKESAALLKNLVYLIQCLITHFILTIQILRNIGAVLLKFWFNHYFSLVLIFRIELLEKIFTLIKILLIFTDLVRFHKRFHIVILSRQLFTSMLDDHVHETNINLHINNQQTFWHQSFNTVEIIIVLAQANSRDNTRHRNH